MKGLPDGNERHELSRCVCCNGVVFWLWFLVLRGCVIKTGNQKMLLICLCCFVRIHSRLCYYKHLMNNFSWFVLIYSLSFPRFFTQGRLYLHDKLKLTLSKHIHMKWCCKQRNCFVLYDPIDGFRNLYEQAFVLVQFNKTMPSFDFWVCQPCLTVLNFVQTWISCCFLVLESNWSSFKWNFKWGITLLHKV